MSTEARPAARVLDAAIKIARNAPSRRGTYVSHAKIYWPHIIELRDALDALGVEWRTEPATHRAVSPSPASNRESGAP